jgi:hypothetical protein
MNKVPALAASRLAAIVAGTYRGGNDLRSLDALVKRGLVVLVDRDATLADVYRYRRAGEGVAVTDLGIAWIQSQASLVEWIEANRTERCLLPAGA